MKKLIQKLGWLLLVSLSVLTFFTCNNDDDEDKYGSIEGIVTDAEDIPLEGLTLVLPESGEQIITGPDGFFAFEDVLEGAHELTVLYEKESLDPETNEPLVDIIEIEAGVKVVVKGGRVVVVEVKVEIKVLNKLPPPAPAIQCRPWSGIISSSQAGEPRRVVAGGGARPANPCNERTTVKVTKPNGEVETLQPGDLKKYEPAETGVWKVEVEVDGRTATSTVTVR